MTQMVVILGVVIVVGLLICIARRSSQSTQVPQIPPPFPAQYQWHQLHQYMLAVLPALVFLRQLLPTLIMDMHYPIKSCYDFMKFIWCLLILCVSCNAHSLTCYLNINLYDLFHCCFHQQN